MVGHLLGQSHASGTFFSKCVSKSIPAAKSQNFVDISGVQKPTWAKLLEFDFFYLKSLKNRKAQKQGKTEILMFFGKLYLTFSLI